MRFGRVLLAAAIVSAAACASRPVAGPVAAPAVPRFAEYPSPDVPATLAIDDATRARHASAWNLLQSGDVRGASREYAAILKTSPTFYPAETGLGFTHLASRQYREALPRFDAALARDERYVQAWVGRSDALLGLERDADAIDAMERVLALDPQRETVRTRLELVRFRLTQASLDAGTKARAAGRYDEAVRAYEQALASSPQSPMILRELAQVHTAAGQLADAERYARRVVQIEPREGQWQALLGDVLAAGGRLADASDAYAAADRLDPNPEWRAKSRDLRERAEVAALPPEFGRLTAAETITRADVAAYLGIHLRDMLAAAPARATTVATDVRDHWAAPWIMAVTRAGVMTTFANHTFQPGTQVRRADLAAVAAALVRAAAAPGNARVTLAAWEAARPALIDVAPANVFFRPASLAVAAGTMATDADRRFNPTRPATGADLDAVVRRIADLTR